MILQNAEQGSCHGDSGGPLIFENTDAFPNRHVQIGIVTGAAVCGDERFPGAYARVDHPDIWNFIYDKIKINSTESTTTTQSIKEKPLMIEESSTGSPSIEVTTQKPINCFGRGIWRNALISWCNLNCRKGNCPLSSCICN